VTWSIASPVLIPIPDYEYNNLLFIRPGISKCFLAVPCLHLPIAAQYPLRSHRLRCYRVPPFRCLPVVGLPSDLVAVAVADDAGAVVVDVDAVVDVDVDVDAVVVVVSLGAAASFEYVAIAVVDVCW